MDHFIKIYRSKAKQYQRLIEAEDVENNLLANLLDITTFQSKIVLDLGSGTGRLPLLLRKYTPNIIGLDLHMAMLREQIHQRTLLKGTWDLLQGDMQQLPFPDQFSEVVLAGWAMGHFVGWYPDDWRQRVRHVIEEMVRVTKPSGVIIILETLGTGSLEAAPPHQGLAEYYSILENEWGFTRREAATDYQFKDPKTAIDKTKFFFGPELSQKIRANQWARVPEWTGIWAKLC